MSVIGEVNQHIANQRIAIALLAAFVVQQACTTVLVEPPAVTPQRPTFSSDTMTTAPGAIEVESGVAINPGDAFDSPILLKVGLGVATEVVLGISPYVYLDRPGEDVDGIGDAVIGTRHRFREGGDGDASMAVQVQAKLPSADDAKGLGTGEVDLFGAWIVSQDFGGWSTTLFTQLGWLDASRSDPAVEYAMAAAVGFGLDDRWSLFSELTAVIQPETDFEPLFLTVGTTFAPQPYRVFDAALVIGWNGDAPDFRILFGMTTHGGTWRRADR